MILQVDIGNSRIKWRLRRRGITLESGVACHGDFSWLSGLSCQRVWVSSVAPSQAQALSGALNSYGHPEAEFARTQAQAGAVVNGYKEPASLGVDRWLLLLAARQAHTGAVLIVDAGTALTVDLLAASGQHLGGYIAPGLQLMRDSLAHKSNALKVALAPGVPLAPGGSSATAIEAALTIMGRGLIESGRLALAEAEGEALVQCVFTGGDGVFWQQVVAAGTVEHELLFAGLECYFSADQE